MTTIDIARIGMRALEPRGRTAVGATSRAGVWVAVGATTGSPGSGPASALGDDGSIGDADPDVAGSDGSIEDVVLRC